MIFTQTLPLLKPHEVGPVLLPRSAPPPEPQPTDTGLSQNNMSATRTIVVNNPFPATHSIALQHTAPDPEIPQLPGLRSMDATNLSLMNNSTGSSIRGPNRPLIVSNLSEGRIIRRVTPTYPTIAKAAGIQGEVVLEAVISRAGRIENLRAVSGHPMLVRAAEAAVSQWQFRPYILNGAPIEVMTQITVAFRLNRE
jgi:protein TonB